MQERRDKRIEQEAVKKKICVSANNLLYLYASPKADAFMRIYNVSDVEGDGCGNGSICVGKYLCERFEKDSVIIETVAGLIEVRKVGSNDFQLKLGEVKHKAGDVKKFFINNHKSGEMINLEIELTPTRWLKPVSSTLENRTCHSQRG